jgi:O-antigen/teichoic acid export membrane protein
MLFARALMALAVTLVVVVAREPIARLATGNGADGPLLALLFVSLPIAAVFDGYTHEIRSREEHGKVALLTVLRTLVQNGLTLALVIGLGMGLAGLIGARPVTDLLLFAIGSVFCWSFVRGRFRKATFENLWAFGWPIGLLTVLGALRGLDRPLIRHLSSVDHVAAYDLAMRFVGPIALPSLALGLVLQPLVYRHASSPETPRMIDLFVRAYVGVFSIIAMGVAVLAPEIIPLIAPAPYHAAVAAVPPLMFFQLVDGLMRVAGIGAELVKRTRVWAIATFAGVVVGMSLVPALVPSFGVGGAGFALFLGSLAGTLLTYVLSLRVSGLVLPVPRGAALALAGALIATLAVVSPWPFAARALLFLVFAGFAWWVSGVRIATLQALWRSR